MNCEKNHAIVNTSKCVGENIDALNACGIYADADLDNGVLVKLVKIAQDSNKNIEGFEWMVQPASASDTNVWVVKTSEVSNTLIGQVTKDPRYFYNVKGEPMSIMKLRPNCDYLEYEANGFTEKTMPDGGTNTFATIGAGGKLTAARSAPESGGYFEFIGKHYIPVGAEEIPSVILRYVEKVAAV